MADLNKESMAIWKSLKPMIDEEIKAQTRGSVQRRKMKVTTAPSLVTNVIGVTEPYGSEMFIPFNTNLSAAHIGDVVWVEFMYGATNAFASMYASADTKDWTVGGTLDVTGNTTLGGTLDVTGNTTLGGTLDVTGDTTLSGDLSVAGDESVTGDLTVSGDTTLNGVLDVTKRRCSATLSSVGWYRVASFDAPNNVQNGAWGFIIDINITRTYGFTNNELHYIRLFGAYNNIQFLNEVSQSNSLGITKIRYTTSSTKAYIDIYSTVNTNGNAVTVDIVPHTNPTYIKSLKAESLQSVADAPSGETVSASYDFHWDISPTVKDISSSVSLNYPIFRKVATLHNGIVELFIETRFDSYIADYEYTIGTIAAEYAPKENKFFTGHTTDDNFNPRGLVTLLVYTNGTMAVRINNTGGNYPILHATYSIF